MPACASKAEGRRRDQTSRHRPLSPRHLGPPPHPPRAKPNRCEHAFGQPHGPDVPLHIHLDHDHGHGWRENREGGIGCKSQEMAFPPDRPLCHQGRSPGTCRKQTGAHGGRFHPARAREWFRGWITSGGHAVLDEGVPGLDRDGDALTRDAANKDNAGHPRSAGTPATGPRLAREADVPPMRMPTLSHLS